MVINRATYKDGETRVGNRNFFMEGVHVSHDTKILNYCTFGYGTKVAGDCEIANGVMFSSGVIINPEVRIGGGTMITSGVRISKDVPPFIVATHNPVTYGGLNINLLKASGTDEKVIAHIANAYRLLFHGKTATHDAIRQIKEQVPESKEIRILINFLENTKLDVITKI